MKHALLLLAAVALFTTGCIERRVALHLRYDEGTDVLRVLYVHTHILGHDDNERDWIVKTWRWRERLIPTLRILGYHAYLRVAADKYQQIDLDSPDKVEPVESKTDVPLDKIVIKPGDLFVGPDKALAYTHEVRFPGQVIDAALRHADQGLRDQFQRLVESERQRRTGGGVVSTWGECRESMIQAMRNIGTDESKQGIPFHHCLSGESLDQLAAAATGGKIRFARKGAVVSVGLPLTAADRRELARTIDAVREVARVKAKEHALTKSTMELLESVIAREEGDELRLSCHLPADAKFIEPAEALSEDDALLLAETLAAVKAAGVPVRSDVELGEVIAKFRE